MRSSGRAESEHVKTCEKSLCEGDRNSRGMGTAPDDRSSAGGALCLAFTAYRDCTLSVCASRASLGLVLLACRYWF